MGVVSEQNVDIGILVIKPAIIREYSKDGGFS